MIQIAAVFAELERETIVENVRAGLGAARARGVRLGRPPREIPVQTLKEALALRKHGNSWSAIGKLMGIPVSSIRDALRKTPPKTPH